MAFSHLFVSTLVVIFTASARVQACSPDFQGRDITISNGYGGEWTLSGSASGSAISTQNPQNVDNSSGEFRVEQDGSWPAAYIIKPLNVPGDIVAVSTASGQAHLETLITNDSSQKYIIECYSCSANGANAEGCRIISKATNNCLSSLGPGENIGTFVCHPRSSGQFWRFIAAPI
ncbi:hypothetical protein BDV98DRAFT_571229 [Pterulicium gracile]|uniref:Ricin B lectin domain-containing protein n=1 Tax=Pterulicium gracile TaxID=1884261 RepID=A0A5C3QGH8_9AGAR|nr:hypothetical protein BDV98DRAFT_571229 [Pterula gracilis]